MRALLAAAAACGSRRNALFDASRLLFAAATTSSAPFSSSSTSKPPPPSPPTTVTLEVRAGTVGLDASLFAAELFRAYSRHSAAAGWEWHELRRLSGGAAAGSDSASSSSSSEGVKLAVARIKGLGVAESLKNEAGVHRVQRVPATESGGRQHSSATTVAVLLEEEEEESSSSPSSSSSSSSSRLLLDPDDFRIDTMRSSGKGGQHANATDSAVRAVHLPSGLAVAVRSGRSQHRNRAAAVAELSRRIRERDESSKTRRVASERRGQVGGGDRSEKIRT